MLTAIRKAQELAEQEAAETAPPAPRAYWESRTYHEFDRWQMIHELACRDANFYTSGSRSQHLARLQSLDRGKPYYTDLDKDELQEFRVGFEVFLKFAPELRLCVYEAYIDGLPHKPDTPTPPPLAAVSRQIRNEFLPVFWERSFFELTFVQRTLREQDPHLIPSSAIGGFLERLSPDVAARMRKIVINVMDKQITKNMVWDMSVMKVVIDAGGDGYEVQGGMTDDGRESMKYEERFYVPLCSLLAQGAAQKEGKGFRMEDITAVTQFFADRTIYPD